MINQEEKTNSYYDNFSDIYPLIWDSQIHTGLFKGKEDLKTACQNMNEYLAKQSKIKESSKILNIGCGQGDVDRYLANNFRATVMGLDISKSQLEKAKMKLKQEKSILDISYIQGTMTKIPSENSSFDYLWVQQSFFHCLNKKKAIAEFNRILKNEGEVIIEDSILKDLSSKEEVLFKFGKRLNLNEISTIEEIIMLFTSQGFKLKLKIDLSENLKQTYLEVIKKINSLGKFGELTHGFQESYKLVDEGKLGSIFLVFQKVTYTPFSLLNK